MHRDIKPANLMQNEVGTTKIADLGLATHLEAEATEADDKKIFGTPHFISPEQARGERVDCRSDLYSLGATAYRLLSGRTPFEGATTRDILRGHFFERPGPLAELAPGLPPELERIVARLLEKKPDDRYPSAAVLLKEIDRLRSVSVHGVGSELAPRRSRAGLLAGAALALVALVVLAFALTRGGGRNPAQGGPLANAGTGPGAPGGTGPSGPQGNGALPPLVDPVPPSPAATTPSPSSSRPRPSSPTRRSPRSSAARSAATSCARSRPSSRGPRAQPRWSTRPSGSSAS